MAQVALETGAGCWYQIRSDVAITTEATIGELDETQTWHGRSSHSSVTFSKYEEQSSELISDAIKHGIICGARYSNG